MSETETPLKTPLYSMHVEHGGKIVPFAGYLLPVALGLGLGTALVLLVPPLIKRGQTRRTRTAS